MGAQLTNLDPSYIMETITRQITGGLTEGMKIFDDINYLLAVKPDQPNTEWYKVGLALGRLVKIFFDFTVNN